MLIDLSNEIDEPTIDLENAEAVANFKRIYGVLHFYRGYVVVNKSLGTIREITSPCGVDKRHFILDAGTGSLSIFKSPQETEPDNTYHLQAGQAKTSECNIVL